MGQIRYGVNLLTYHSAGYDLMNPRTVDKILGNLSSLGYQGVEVLGTPEKIKKLKPIIELISSHKLETVCIGGAWGVFGALVGTYPNKDPTSLSRERISDSIEYIGRCCDMCVTFGARYMLVALGPLERPVDDSERGIGKARKSLIEVLTKSAKLAEERDVTLLVEPQCRFEGYYGVNSTIEQTLSVIKAVDRENVGLMLDTFHSNIEETSIPKAIRRAGRLLKHVHFADSNRLAPGFGSMDFKPILRELVETGYDGYVDLECMPARPDPDTLVREGMEYMKSLESLARIQVRSR